MQVSDWKQQQGSWSQSQQRMTWEAVGRNKHNIFNNVCLLCDHSFVILVRCNYNTLSCCTVAACYRAVAVSRTLDVADFTFEQTETGLL